MFIVCFGLLVAGMWVLSQAFVTDVWQGPVFVLGILVIAFAWALAMRPLGEGGDAGRPDAYARNRE